MSSQGANLGSALMPTIKPSVIWAIDFEEGHPHFCAEGSIGCEPDRGNFRWLHLSLADQVTRGWIRDAASLPEDMRDLLLGPEQHQRAQVSNGWVGCVLHDVERDFDRLDTERTGVLRMIIGERIIITARLHPVRSADLVRKHIERDGMPVRDRADALDLVVSAIVENVSAVARAQEKVIEVLEDDLLDEGRAFDHRRLIHLRRRIVQFHRLLGGMRAVFKRMETDEDMPEVFGPTIEKLSQQLGAIDGEMLSFQSQLRLLREEADLQATQRTNRNLYVLSILTALLLPATMVTGFFGMNTGGLPFAGTPEGTIIATFLAIAASGVVYWLLRVMGLDRQK
jgi:zinc transporter